MLFIIFSLGGILKPKNAKQPAKGIANSGMWEKAIDDFVSTMKMEAEKSPKRTKKVSAKTDDL